MALKPNKFQEYPKLIYGPEGQKSVVNSLEEEHAKKAAFEPHEAPDSPKVDVVEEIAPAVDSGPTEVISSEVSAKKNRGRPKKG